MELRVKLGSFKHPDPVAALRQAYSRALGEPQLWWAEPTADALRDERFDLFKVLDAHRVFKNHEIFAFDDKEDCLRTLEEFSVGFRQRTMRDDKPPHIDNLDATWLPQQEAAEELARKRAERRRLKEDQAMSLADEHARKTAIVSDKVDAFLREQCDVGAHFKVKASVLNRLLKPLGVPSVSAELESRGFVHTKGRLLGYSGVVRLYKGVRLKK